ncbi:uncharacterized protein LOC135838254 [Planococcus citri]|uniref:uncharacterized protein LOC135838254 n=1 Tax=Planococcus citri TaxID=170843 RepID=UPI0031F78197
MCVTRTGCCGNSLHTASLVVLYINLVMNLYEIVFFSHEYRNLINSKLLENELVKEENSNIIFTILETLVFLYAIRTVSKMKSSMLTFSMVILLIDMISIAHSTFNTVYKYHKKCISNTTLCGPDGILGWTVKSEHAYTEAGKLATSDVRFSYIGVLITLSVTCLFFLCFKFYSIMILQSYKSFLKFDRIQLEMPESSAEQNELPCYSYVRRPDAPPRYVSNGNVQS